MLKKAKVWLDEGYIFGREGRGFERINVACPRSILSQGLQRIEKTVNSL
jgi:cystathionine beta-lyase